MGTLSLIIKPDRRERSSERIRIITPQGDEIIINVTKKNGPTSIHVNAPSDIRINRESFISGEWKNMRSSNGQD